MEHWGRGFGGPDRVWQRNMGSSSWLDAAALPSGAATPWPERAAVPRVAPAVLPTRTPRTEACYAKVAATLSRRALRDGVPTISDDPLAFARWLTRHVAASSEGPGCSRATWRQYRAAVAHQLRTDRPDNWEAAVEALLSAARGPGAAGGSPAGPCPELPPRATRTANASDAASAAQFGRDRLPLAPRRTAYGPAPVRVEGVSSRARGRQRPAARRRPVAAGPQRQDDERARCRSEPTN